MDNMLSEHGIESDGSVIKNGWNTWAKYIIMELKRLDGTDKDIVINMKTLHKELIDEIKSAHTALKTDIEKKFDVITNATDKKIESLESSVKEQSKELERLKLKAGIWGAVAGLIPVVIGIVLQIVVFLSKK